MERAALAHYIPMATFNIVVVATLPQKPCVSNFLVMNRFRLAIPDPTPPITNDRTAFIVGNCRTEVAIAASWTSCECTAGMKVAVQR